MIIFSMTHHFRFDRKLNQKNDEMLITVVCVYKDTLYKDNMAEIWPKPTLLDFGRPSIRTIWQKIQKGLFFKNIKNSPLFRKNMGEEQKKKDLQKYL